MSAFDIILSDAPYSKRIKSYVVQLKPEIEKFPLLSKPKLFLIRNRLNEFFRQNNGYDAKCIAQCLCFILKRIAPDALSQKEKTDKHKVSDHAFCMAVLRLGYDLKSLKDSAYKESMEAGLIPIYGPKNILTFLPKE